MNRKQQIIDDLIKSKNKEKEDIDYKISQLKNDFRRVCDHEWGKEWYWHNKYCQSCEICGEVRDV